jgi:hypothetical protein
VPRCADCRGAKIADQLFVETGRADDLINNLLWLFDGPQQREAQRLPREALGEDFGNNA